MKGTRTSSTFDGRWVNTMVFSRPIRLARRPAAMDEALCSRPAPKNTTPMSPTEAPNFL